jgi:hypothetical protein
MSEPSKLTYLAGLAISVGLVAAGAYMILRERQKDETEAQVVPRQLRGFFFLILGSLILSVGSNLASGSLDISQIVKGLRP